MNCNCQNIYPDCDMNKWESCPSSIIVDADNYYTKSQVDKKIEDIEISGGVTSGQVVSIVDTKLVDYALKEEIPSLDGYATEQWVNDQGFLKTHQSLEGYATEDWVEDKGYLTEHQDLSEYAKKTFVSAYTYDKSTIDEKVSQGGTFDPTQYYNKNVVDALLLDKANTASTYSKNDVNDLLDDKTDTATTEALQSSLTSHTANTDIHVTLEEKNAWNAKADSGDVYTKTEVDNLLDDKQDLLTAGHDIDISTANTVSFKLNISGDTEEQALSFNASSGSGWQSAAFGNNTKATNSAAFAQGTNTKASGKYSVATGSYSEASNFYAFSMGQATKANGVASLTQGDTTSAQNRSEAAFGSFNVSSKDSNEFGSSGNTHFSIGTGKVGLYKNAFEVMQNDDIYIQKDGEKIKLQDHLGADMSNYYTKTEVDNTFLKSNKIWCGTQTQYDAITDKDSDTIYLIHE